MTSLRREIKAFHRRRRVAQDLVSVEEPVAVMSSPNGKKNRDHRLKEEQYQNGKFLL